MRFSFREHHSWVLVAFCCIGAAGSLACREQASAQSASIFLASSQPLAEPRATPATSPRAADPALKNRAITFSLDDGDMTVTGAVRTETERQKINELAMQISGVKSVANAVRVTTTP